MARLEGGDGPEEFEADLSELDAALDRFQLGAERRGAAYAIEGRVRELTVEPGIIQATVRGTRTYEVTWYHEGGEWWSECTCPIGNDCKHAYATALCALQANVGIAAAPAPARPPARKRSPFDVLRSAPTMWDREEAIRQMCAERQGMALPWIIVPHDVFSEPDPDVLCWRAALAIRRQTNGWLPEALEPFRDRPDLAERVAERERSELVRALGSWARLQGTAERSLTVEIGLAVAHDGTVRLRSTPLLTTPRLTDAPRTITQLRQLRGEVQQRPNLLPAAATGLLVWLTDNNVGSDTAAAMMAEPFGPAALLERVAQASLGRWSRDLPPELAARAGIEPGAAIRWANDPVRLLPALVHRDDTTWVELHFHWPDGRRRPASQAVHLADANGWSRPRASAVLAEGTASPVVSEPPANLADRLQSSGGLSIPAAERPAMLGLLTPAFPHLRETVAAHTRFHPVTATVTLDLRDRDWLQLRIFARTVEDRTFEHDPDGRWTILEASHETPAMDPIVPVPDTVSLPAAPDPEDLWLEAPDPAVADPLAAWITASPAVPGARGRPGGHEAPYDDRNVGWWVRLGPRTVEALAEAWDSRPAGVTWLGTPAVRRLLDPTERVTPRLRIESSGTDWFKVSAQWEAEGLALTERDLAALRAASARFVRLEGGWVRRETTAAVDEAAAVLSDLGIEVGEEAQKLSLWTLAGARPETLGTLERLGTDTDTIAAARTLRERIVAFKGLPKTRLPRRFKATLRPYQQQGFDFLAHAASLGIGAILADDMGLGKTVQALAWLAHLRAAEPEAGPSLVVCPASVMGNWVREAARFAPALRVLLLERGEGRHALREAMDRHDVVVTNYALLRRDAEAWGAVELQALVLDEAQNVKNPDAGVTRVAQTLTARHRLALTGTPLENRALDLWSIMSTVNPGYLGNRATFTTRFDRVDTPPWRRALLAARLRPVMLRRLKRTVATELPERIEERRDCDLTPGQRRLYLAELRRSRALVDRLAGEPGGLARRRIDVLAALTRLRQICCHPSLVGGRDAAGSGKFDALFELIEPLRAEGHKVLVFSQFVECLKLLATELRRRTIGFHMLTGSTTRRDAVVEAFATDPEPNPFLISLRAGGTGLNLTAASYVVLFDPWWNPAVEAQAIDRTHRIGQDQTVIAYRLIARGTVEEKIWDLQQRKAALMADVLGEGGFGRTLTREDFEFLLRAE